MTFKKLWLPLTFISLAGFYVFLGYHYSWDLSQLKLISPMFWAIGMSLACVDLILRGLRIMLVCRCMGHRVRLLHALKIMLSVDFFAAITPARIGGEAARLGPLL